jgi:hypothetical protein
MASNIASELANFCSFFHICSLRVQGALHQGFTVVNKWSRQRQMLLILETNAKGRNWKRSYRKTSGVPIKNSKATRGL